MKMLKGIIWGLGMICWQGVVHAGHGVSDEKLIQATADLSKQVVLSTQVANQEAKNQAYKLITQALITLGGIPERPTTGGFVDAGGDGWEFQPMINIALVLQKAMSAISSDASDVTIYNGMIQTAKVQILTQFQASCGKATYSSERSACMMRALSTVNPQEAMIDYETAKLSILNGCKVATYTSERVACFNASIDASQSPDLLAQVAGCKAISSDSSKSSCFIEALSQ